MCMLDGTRSQGPRGFHGFTSVRAVAAAAKDAAAALAWLVVLHACAHAQIGTSGVQLHEKMALQGKGIGYVLDTTSGHVILLYHVAQLGRRAYGGKWFATPLALWTSLTSGLAFGLVAVAFHYVQDGSGDESNPLFMVFFAVTGALDLYSLVSALRLVSGVPAERALARATVHLACLAVAPLAVLLVGGRAAPALINQFFLNGYVFVFVAATVEPVLKAAQAATGVRQFAAARLLLPALVGCFLFEGAMVRNFDIDAHVCTHVLVLGFVATLVSGLSGALDGGVKPKA